MKHLSVIIVNYNGLKYLRGCLDSLIRHLEGVDHEIIIVDNNSTDSSCAYIKENYPGVKRIESKVNLGFGRGNNKGAKHAKGKHLLLINNDTIVLQSLKPALHALEKDNTIGALGIKMLDGNGEYLISAGKFPSVASVFRMKNMFRMGTEFKTGSFSRDTYNVDWITGAFMLIPSEVYKKTGGFDEDYFMYVEDVDLCKKIADAGYARVFMPGLSYIHFVGHNKSKNHLLVKGNRLYIHKHMAGAVKVLSLLALGINAAVKKISS